MKLQDIVNVLEQIAPTRYAEPWDNVGLLAGDVSQDVSAAMLTIDFTPAVADEAAAKNCELVVAYHPPLFHAVKRLTADNLVFQAIHRGVAIYSPHTALDVADGGTNDVLADIVGLTERRPLRIAEGRATQYKLVTFVPEQDAEKVSRALFDAGAGRIGDYSSCSFLTKGTGTFFGEQGTNPAVGKSGRLERADEIRLETVVPISAIERVIRALREAHPYEEPAFDLNQLAALPEGVGIGRIGTMPPTPRGEIFQRIRQGLGLERLLIAGPSDGEVRTAAMCAGAGADFLDDAIAQKADLYLTGELSHHHALRAQRAAMTVVCTLHSNSERAVLKRLADRLRQKLPALAVSVSQTDRDPFSIR